MHKIIKIIASIILISVFPLLLQTETELPLHKKRLSEKVLVVWTGDYMQTIATVALATKKGIVVIEASLFRKNDARIRREIEKEFGRNDIKYLINTHYHHDHTAANQIYSDATIIAHKNVPAGIKKELTGEGLIKLIDKFKGMFKDMEEAQEHVEPQSRDYYLVKERIYSLKQVIEELQSGFVPTYPSILFEKSLTIDMGDMTLQLYSFGGMHTDSDIVIFIPEEGLVVVGDLPPDRWLPYIRKELISDFSVTLENWSNIVNSKWDIKHLNMAHSNMHLSVETFKEQYRYLNTLWNDLTEMHRQGLTIEDAKKKYTIEKDFPYFKDRIVKTSKGDIHEYNIEAIWERISKK